MWDTFKKILISLFWLTFGPFYTYLIFRYLWKAAVEGCIGYRISILADPNTFCLLDFPVGFLFTFIWSLIGGLVLAFMIYCEATDLLKKIRGFIREQ